MSSSDNPQFDPQPPALSTELPVLEPLTPVADATGPFALTPAVPAVALTGLPPVENPVWSGWDVLLIAALTLVTMLVLQFGLVLADLWLYHPHQTFVEVAQHVAEQPILVIVLQLLIYVPVAAFMIMLVEGKYHVPFWQAIRWNWPRSEWKPLALGAATFVVLGLLESSLPMPKDTPFEHLFDRPRDAYLLAILAVSIAPLMEELFFRGFLYSVVARRWGAGWAIFLAALPFALLHLQQYGYAWLVVLMIFVVGVVCGIVRAVTRSVAASFLVHVGYNGLQMLIAVVATHGFRHMPKP